MVSENSKTWKTFCYLKDQFAAGAFPNGRLPKECVLAAELNISRNTLRAALALLEDECLIVRKRHAGTRWVGKPAMNKTSQNVIGLLARTTGHVYSDFYQQILMALTRYGLGIRVISTDGLDGCSKPPERTSLEKNVSRLLNAETMALLIDGYCFWKMPHTKALLSGHPILFDFLDGPLPAEPVTGVWLDYEKAGYLGGTYLLENGCKRPLLIPAKLQYYTRMAPENYERHRERQIIAGYSRALQEHGLDPQCYILDPLYRQKELEMLFYNLLEDPSVRPDGIFASRDYLIIIFLKIATELRMDVSSIKLVGGGNTPWSQEDSLHPFTSIDFHFDRCAVKLVEQALLPPEQRENIYIEPELLER